jgi:hypothetical protein
MEAAAGVLQLRQVLIQEALVALVAGVQAAPPELLAPMAQPTPAAAGGAEATLAAALQRAALVVLAS